VVSSSQGEVADFREKGLDIRPHRARMINENLDEKFKDAKNPLRIVFVCAMWMTGFDVKSCSTIYLDKPMRNHTLMQTIARANRVWQDKPHGLIVDYIGVFRNLQEALAIYAPDPGRTDESEMPIRNKEGLIEMLEDAIRDAEAFCHEHGVSLEQLLQAAEWDYIRQRDDAVEALILNDETKRRYLALAREVDRLFRAILPDDRASEYGPYRAVIVNIAKRIQASMPSVDISEFMADVERLLDSSITAEGYVLPETTEESLIDLSQIDFDALRERFQQGRQRTEAEKLRGHLNVKLRQMVRLNKTRIDYLERLQRLIDEYNAGTRNVESFFEELIRLTQDLNQEEQRHLAEQLTEEEQIGRASCRERV
jgi:type I restriction enzyme, R subunit